MKPRVVYTYRTFDLGCGCCSDSEITLEIIDEDGRWTEHLCWEYCENAHQLHSFLKEYHPELTDYEIVEEDCSWF